jgi:oleandomycin transport system permease protein
MVNGSAAEANGLRKAYGDVQALDGLSLAVPAGTVLPRRLQAFGAHQPVGALVNAERALILGGPAAHDVPVSLAWSGGLLVVFALLAVRTCARMGR